MAFGLELFLLFVAVGLVAGFVAGFVGVGGGIIMVPVLLEVFRLRDLPPESIVQAAMGTSLAVAVFSVTSALIRHQMQGRVRWSLVPMLAPGSLLGGLLAANIATHVPGTWLKLGLGILMILSAVRMFWEKQPPVGNGRSLAWGKGIIIGLGVGLVAGFTGLAGGIVLVPVLALILHVPTGWLAGTSTAIIIFSSLAAGLGYYLGSPPVDLGPGFHGYTCVPLAASLIVGSIPGAQIGAWVNRRTKSLLFRRIFAAIMILVVIRLFATL